MTVVAGGRLAVRHSVWLTVVALLVVFQSLFRVQRRRRRPAPLHLTTSACLPPPSPHHSPPPPRCRGRPTVPRTLTPARPLNPCARPVRDAVPRFQIEFELTHRVQTSTPWRYLFMTVFNPSCGWSNRWTQYCTLSWPVQIHPHCRRMWILQWELLQRTEQLPLLLGQQYTSACKAQWSLTHDDLLTSVGVSSAPTTKRLNRCMTLFAVCVCVVFGTKPALLYNRWRQCYTRVQLSNGVFFWGNKTLFQEYVWPGFFL